MSQATTWGVPSTGPATPAAYAGRDNESFDALLSSHKAAARPAYAMAGTVWVDEVSASIEARYYFDGTDDILIGYFDIANNICVCQGARGILEKTDNYTIQAADMNQMIALTCATTKTLTIPAAAAGYKGAWLEVYSLGAGIIVLTLASGNWWNTALAGASIALGPKTKIWCDGSYWYASPATVLIAPATFNITEDSWTLIDISASVPLTAKRIWGIISTGVAGATNIGGASSTNGYIAVQASAGNTVTAPFALDIYTPGTVWGNKSTANGSILITGFGF